MTTIVPRFSYNRSLYTFATLLEFQPLALSFVLILGAIVVF